MADLASTSFNGLSPAELERLALLSEELGEAQQAIGKILRHGYESHNPLDENGNEGDNRRDLEKELGHVRHAINRLCEAGDLSSTAIYHHEERKRESVTRWLHHQ